MRRLFARGFRLGPATRTTATRAGRFLALRLGRACLGGGGRLALLDRTGRGRLGLCGYRLLDTRLIIATLAILAQPTLFAGLAILAGLPLLAGLALFALLLLLARLLLLATIALLLLALIAIFAGLAHVALLRLRRLGADGFAVVAIFVAVAIIVEIIEIVAILAVLVLLLTLTLALLVEAGASLGEHTEIMVRELEIIFGHHPIALGLGVTREIAVFLVELDGVAARPIVDPVAAI